MNYVKGNLLTILVGVIATIVAFMLQIDSKIAFLIWLSAFMLDASYTYLNRKYIHYELNIIVRRSKDIELAFIKVAIVESVMIIGAGMVFEAMVTSSDCTIRAMASGSVYTNTINGVIGCSDFSIGYALSFMLFASIHIMAFVRSYLFIKRFK